MAAMIAIPARTQPTTSQLANVAIRSDAETHTNMRPNGAVPSGLRRNHRPIRSTGAGYWPAVWVTS